MTTRTTDAERRFWNMLTVAFALPISAVVLLWTAWWLMLGLGAAHDVWPQVPALGYWTTYLIAAGLSSMSAVLRWKWTSENREDR